MGLRSVSILVLILSANLMAAGSDLRLIEASKSGDAKAVRALLAQRVPVTAVDAEGATALHYAAAKRNTEIADLLIAGSAQVNAANRYNITPLFLACGNGDAAMVARLLKAGADANRASEEGQTPLMSAALAGNVDVIKVLLSHGAKVNAVEPVRGQTAVMWAAS